MAKRKKQKVKSRRRRSVSGVSSNLKSTLMVVGGVAAAAFLGMQLKKLTEPKEDGTESKITPKMLAAAQVLAGALLVPKFVPGAMGAGLGNGLVAVGTIQLLTDMKVITGIGSSDSVDFSINGVEVVGSTDLSAQTLIAGVE